MSSDAAGGDIPLSVRPLLNFVVWKTHNRGPSPRETGQYILLTNDSNTQRQAQKFGVRAKMLAQVRGIVAKSAPRTTPTNGVHRPLPIEPLRPDEDFEEVVFKPHVRSRSPGARSPKQAQNVLDPNHFGRDPPGSPRAQGAAPATPAAAARSSNGSSRRSTPAANRPTKQQQVARPIDPDSYARPSPGPRRGRGNHGRLWEPT